MLIRTYGISGQYVVESNRIPRKFDRKQKDKDAMEISYER